MRGTDELVLVLTVACETADRTPEEQRAMLACALRVDVDRAKFTITNPEPVRPHLFADVEHSYDPSEGRRAAPPRAQKRRAEKLVADFDRNLAEHEAMQARRATAGAAQRTEDKTDGRV